MLIQGGCHCGNISFGLRWDPDPAQIVARACGCSFCTRHGGVWTSHPAGALTVRIRAPDTVSRYVFGTATAVFHVCAVCGVVPLVTSEIDDKLYAVVNVNTFTGVEAALLQRRPADFATEGEAERLARRKRGWIGTVRFEPGGA
jgi:hypothetical protein